MDRGDVLLTWRFGGAYPEPTVVSIGLPYDEWLAVELELDSVFVEPGPPDIGSTQANPSYERMPRCPGESELCPPFAAVTILGRVLTDCTGFEDGTQCMSAELGGICLDGACAASADCSGLQEGSPCLFREAGLDVPGRCSGGQCMEECQVLEEGSPCLELVGGEMGICEAGVCMIPNQ